MVKLRKLAWLEQKGPVCGGEWILSRFWRASSTPVAVYLQIPDQMRSEARIDLKHSKRTHSRHHLTIKISFRLVSHLVDYDSVEKSHHSKIKWGKSGPKKQAFHLGKMHRGALVSPTIFVCVVVNTARLITELYVLAIWIGCVVKHCRFGPAAFLAWWCTGLHTHGLTVLRAELVKWSRIYNVLGVCAQTLVFISFVFGL